MTSAGVVSRRRVTFDIAIQLVGQVVNLLLGVVVTLVVVRTLGEHRFGQWSTIVAVAELLGYIGELGIDRVTVRQASADPEREGEWLGALVSLRFLLSIPVTLAFLAITLAISADGTMRATSVVFAVMSIIPPISCLSIVFQLRVRNDLSVLTLTLNSVLWTTAGLVLAVLSGAMVAFALALVGASLVTVAVQTVLVKRMAHVRLRASRPLWGELWRFALPVGIASMLTFAYGRIDQVLVYQITGSDQAGIYGAMYRILTTVAFVPMIVMRTLFPILSRVDKAQMRRMIQLALDYLAMASLPIFFFVLVASAPIVRVLFGEQYVVGHNALRVLMAAFVSICFGYVGGSLTIVLRLQRVFIRYAVVALIFNLALNVLLLPKYGYIAAAWITLATELLVQTLALRAVFREIQMRPSILRILRTAAAAGGMALAVWAMRSAGASFVWLVLTAAVAYAGLVLGLRVLQPSEIVGLVKRQPPL